MNPQNDLLAPFQHDIAQWELAINSYNGQDPLDLWFRFICWLESNLNTNAALEAKFRKSVEQCLSAYDKFDNYKQDLRMVKLWIKYVILSKQKVFKIRFISKLILSDRLSAESLELV